MLIEKNKLLSIHSSEPTLNDIFIEITGGIYNEAKNLILGDMKFQFKYGFYFYIFLSIIYICIINVFPTFMREKIAIIMIYSDPAAMGLFLWELLYFLRKVKGF